MSDSVLRLRAPAKLNLYLRIIGPRPDGYHEIETLFERIDLADEMTLTVQPQGITVSCDDPALDCGPENLATKAAVLLQQRSGITQGVAIHIAKQIPIASGLGGGSSDAATVLIGLNDLWQLNLSTERLCRLASQLGSDVPFFVNEAAFAIGRGRGQQCEPLRGAARTLWHVLVVPNAQLSTKEVYAGVQFDPSTSLRIESRAKVEGFDLTAKKPSITMGLHALRNGSLGELAKGLYNELEPEAIRRCPVIQEIRSRLGDGGCAGVLTSGSGPAVFGLCQDAPHAEEVAHQIRQHGSPNWLVRVVSTYQGPLTVRLSSD